MNTIHLFASFGNLKKTAAGGGQTSARRLVKLLEGMRYEVQLVNRTIPPYTAETISAKLYKALGFIIDPIRFFFHLLFRSRRDALVIVIGYSGSLFPYYFLFVRIASFLGFKTAIYVKGGFTIAKYDSFSDRIKKCYEKGLESANIAFYEGEEGVHISEKVQPTTKAVWLPNYIENGFSPKQLPNKPKDRFSLLYFGRIQPAKNVHMIVDVFDQLSTRFSNIHLTIVGAGGTEYEKKLDFRIQQSPNKARISRHPRTEHDKLKDILYNHHFFVFPSVEKQEGHSNSLNEAMGYGLVPFVSDNNFLPSIVGNEQLVVHDMKEDYYVNAIEKVILDGDFERLSKEMYDRVRTRFVQSIVEKSLKETIDSLI